MLDIYLGVGLAFLIIGLVGSIMFIGFCGMEDAWSEGFTYGSQTICGAIILALLWPLLLVAMALVLPGFVIWGGFNLARAAKHKSFDRYDWR